MHFYVMQQQQLNMLFCSYKNDKNAILNQRSIRFKPKFESIAYMD